MRSTTPSPCTVGLCSSHFPEVSHCAGVCARLFARSENRVDDPEAARDTPTNTAKLPRIARDVLAHLESDSDTCLSGPVCRSQQASAPPDGRRGRLAHSGCRPHACPLPPARRARSPASLPPPRPPRAAWPSSASAVVRHWWIAADRSFASGLTLPCGCIGTCRLDSHAGRTARGLAVGQIVEIVRSFRRRERSRVSTRALEPVRTAHRLHPNTPLGPQSDSHSELVWQVAMSGDYDRCPRQVLPHI